MGSCLNAVSTELPDPPGDELFFIIILVLVLGHFRRNKYISKAGCSRMYRMYRMHIIECVQYGNEIYLLSTPPAVYMYKSKIIMGSDQCEILHRRARAKDTV